MMHVSKGGSSPDADDGGRREVQAGMPDPAAGLTAALATLGVDCAVEARGSLAVMACSAVGAGTAAQLAEHGLRTAVVEAAHKLGFTHVALELREEDG